LWKNGIWLAVRMRDRDAEEDRRPAQPAGIGTVCTSRSAQRGDGADPAGQAARGRGGQVGDRGGHQHDEQVAPHSAGSALRGLVLGCLVLARHMSCASWCCACSASARYGLSLLGLGSFGLGLLGLGSFGLGLPGSACSACPGSACSASACSGSRRARSRLWPVR
jgi:hypothetical protein